MENDDILIENYLQNQKPLRTGDFNRGVNRIIKHYTPGTVQQLAAQAGTQANQVSAGGANVIQPILATPHQRQQNQVQVQQNLNGELNQQIANWYDDASDFTMPDFLYKTEYQQDVTTTNPLMQNSTNPKKRKIKKL